MPQFINSNIPSLTAQRNLNTSQNDLNTSLQRLSSGLRINSAKDDAAGLAISERFTAQIRGLNQAARNANDGISLAQTAEGDMGAITNNLQRIRELSVQSANATNSASDRAALQLEVSELVSEIDRVASTSAFNGVKLLDGSFSSQAFQVGANAGETVTISSISSARTAALGSFYSATSASTADVNATAIDGSGNFTINGVNIVASTDDGVSFANGDASALAKARAINSSTLSDVSATVVATDATAGAAVTTNSAIASNDLIINNIDIGAVAANATSAAAQGADVVAAINAQSAATGVLASIDGSDVISLTAADGRNITVTATAAGTTGTGFATATNTDLGRLSITSLGTDGLTFGGTAAVYGSAADAAAAQTGTAVSALDISTVSGANTAIASVDAALTTVNSNRAQLGAVQNRFDSVVSSIQTTSENLSASRSRIRDADFAAETAALTRAQILQQAGVSILGQANSLPQNALSLLQ